MAKHWIPACTISLNNEYKFLETITSALSFFVVCGFGSSIFTSEILTRSVKIRVQLIRYFGSMASA